ncbi:MAG TPA: hypothetical protein VI259_18070 [Gemmatimonadaceae bacterium]
MRAKVPQRGISAPDLQRRIRQAIDIAACNDGAGIERHHVGVNVQLNSALEFFGDRMRSSPLGSAVAGCLRKFVERAIPPPDGQHRIRELNRLAKVAANEIEI